MTEIIKPIETPEIKEAKESTRELCENSMNYQVTDLDTFSKSAEIRSMLNMAKKKIESTFKPLIDKSKDAKKEATEALKEANALLEKALRPFVMADNHIREQRELFTREQNRLRMIEEQKAREKAEKEAAKEREKLRIEAEKAKEKARKLEEAGKLEQAEALKEQAEEKTEAIEDVYVKPVAVEPKVSNISKTDNGMMYNKTETIVHLPEGEGAIKAFCKAVVDGKLPIKCVKFSLSDIKAWAKGNDITGPKYGIIVEKKVKEIFKN